MSDQDSEDGQTLAQTFVLSQLANIPAIGETTDAETTGSDDDDEGVPIVFSKINWAEESIDSVQRSPRPGGQGTITAGVVVSSQRAPNVPSLTLTSIATNTPSTSRAAAAAVVDLLDVQLDVGSQEPSDDELEQAVKDDGASNATSPAASPDVATGSGWLLGAAGRLADLTTPRSRTLQVDGPQMRVELQGSEGGSAPSAEAKAAEEEALAQRFHEIVAAGADEDVPGCSTLVLEESVAGVGGGELDALIARLQAGVVLDLDATRPADLPDPSTLFTDSDDEAQAPPPPKPVPPAPKPRPVMPALPPTSTPAAALPRPAVVATPVAAPAGGPPGMMPPHFKMFAAPSVPAAPAAAEPPGDAGADVDGKPARATVVQDLRASIAESLSKVEQARAASGKAGNQAGDDSDSDEDELLAARQQLKAGVKPSPSPLPAKASATAAVASAAKPNAADSARPAAPATASHSIAVGDDEHMGDPGIATGARKSMFVSTSDMVGADSKPGGAAAPVTRSTFVGAHALEASDEEEEDIDDDAIVIGLPRQALILGGAGHATAVSKEPEGSGHATAVSKLNGRSTTSTPATRAMTTAAAPAHAARTTAASSSAATLTASVPQMSQILTDTDDLGPEYGAPAAAPGTNSEKGAKRVGAGTRIKLPPGAQVEVPRPATASSGTQADAPTSPIAAPVPAAAAATAAGPAATKQVATAGGSTITPPSSAPAPPQLSPKGPLHQAPARAAPRADSAAPVPAAAAGPLSFPRLPPWLPASSCFSVVFASPDGMPTHTVAAAVEWLLSQAARNAPPRPSHAPSPTGTVHAAFTVVGLMFAALPPTHPLLRNVPALAGKQGASSAPVRVLVAACTPGEVDTDRARAADYSCDEDAVDSSIRAMRTALSQLTWASLLSALGGQASGSLSEPASPQPAARAAAATGATQGGTESLFLWTSCVEGMDAIASVQSSYALAPATGASSTEASFTTIAGGSVSVPKQAGAAAAGAPAPPAHTAARTTTTALAAGADVVVSTLSRGGTSSPRTLSTVLLRAASVGLSLAGMQTFYATEDTAAYVATRTPHRLLPYTGCVALALVGRTDPAARWQAQLGPPDQEVARKAEPHSLHAILRGSEHKLLACSTDMHGAGRELAMLLSWPADAPAVAPAPAAAMAAQTKSAAPSAMEAVQVVACVEPTAQWLVLRAGTGHELINSLWVMHHLAWCGFSIRALLRMRLGQEQVDAVKATRAMPAALLAAAQEGTPLLVVEVVKEECSTQLPLALADMRALREVAVPREASGGRVSSSGTRMSSSGTRMSSSGAAAALTSPRGASVSSRVPIRDAAQLVLCGLEAGESEALQQVVGGLAAANSLPTAAAAQQLLDSAAKVQAANDDGSVYRAVDGLLVVAVQGKSLPDVLLLALELLRHPHVSAAAPILVPAPGGNGEAVATNVEVVGVRLARHVPPDVSRYLTLCVDVSAALPDHQPAMSGMSGSTAAGGAHVAPVIAGRPGALLPGQPVLLVALHGPGARAQVAAAVSSWRALVRPQATTNTISVDGPDTDVAPAVKNAAGLSVESASLGRALGPRSTQQYAAVGAYHPPLLVATSTTSSDSRLLLAQCFQAGSHVSMDPGFHNGIIRPVLPAQLDATAWLLTTPHPFSTLLAVRMDGGMQSAATAIPKPAPQQLPRCLKLLWREGFVLHAASLVSLSDAAASALHAPQLAGQPVALVWLWRSNAVQHLHTLMAESGLGSAHVVPAPSYTAVQEVLGTTWPGVPLPEQPPAAAAPTVGAQAISAGFGVAAAKSRKLVRDAGAGLMQATCMLLLPRKQLGSSATALSAANELDWATAAEALDAVRSEGFVVAGLQAMRLSPGQVGEVSKLFKLSPQQVATLSTTAAAAAPAGNSFSSSAGGTAVGASVVVVALARHNAVSHLQLRAQEASTLAARGPQAGGAALRGASLAAVSGNMAISGSNAAAEQQLLYFFDHLFGVAQVSISRSG